MDVENDFNAQDLFDKSDHEQEEQDNVIDEAIEAPEPKKKEEEPKKRVIKNPQPKLDPNRICGDRGIGTLAQVFDGKT